MDKLKNDLAPDLHAIANNIYAAVVIAILTVAVAFLLAQADTLGRIGWSAMNQWLALLVYIFLAFGVSVFLVMGITVLRQLFKKPRPAQIQFIDAEDVLSQVERDDVTESSKIEGIKKIEASAANRIQRRRAAEQSYQLWENHIDRANSNMFDISHRASDIESAWVYLEMALRLDPNNLNYQHLREQWYPHKTLTSK